LYEILIDAGLWHLLDPCFVTTHRIHKEGDLQIHIFVIFRETRHHARTHVTSDTPIHCVLSLAAKRTDGSTLGLMISLASVCYGDSRYAKHVFAPAPGLPIKLGLGRSWLFPASSITFFYQKEEPEISVGYI
jgi:hypothetical protein